MPDFEKIIKPTEWVLKLIFGDKIPPDVRQIVGYILLIPLALFFI